MIWWGLFFLFVGVPLFAFGVTRAVLDHGWFMVHNLIAHPLLVIAPGVGQRLHDWTAIRMEEEEPYELPGRH